MFLLCYFLSTACSTGDQTKPQLGRITAITHIPFRENSDDIIVACNNKSLTLCNLPSKHVKTLERLESYPLTLAWQPISRNHESANESFLAVGCSDGRIEFFKAAVEGEKFSLVFVRRIKGHEGSITTINWSDDGSSIMTSAVDGQVLMWSRTGNLRTKVAAFETAVNCMSWGPKCERSVVAHGNCLTAVQTEGRNDSFTWEGDSGTILAVDWNTVKDIIVSGGEDGTFRIFTPEGGRIHFSRPQSHPITSISWFPTGDYFCLGTFGKLALHDSSGTLHDMTECHGDLFQAQDGQKMIACSSVGEIIILSLVGRKVFWNGFSVEHCSNTQLCVASPSQPSQNIDISRYVSDFKYDEFEWSCLNDTVQ